MRSLKKNLCCWDYLYKFSFLLNTKIFFINLFIHKNIFLHKHITTIIFLYIHFLMLFIKRSSQVGDLFLSLVQLCIDLFQQSSHVLFSVQHCPCFLIAFNVMLNFRLQVFVHFFVLHNSHQALVNFSIQDFVLIGKL